MLRQLSTRSQTRRWPMSVFYNILDMCALNAWIIYKSVNKSSISRRDFQLSLLKELCSKTFLDSENSQSQHPTEIQNVSLPRKRAHCAFKKCKNMSATVCIKCRNCICGKHSNGSKISFIICRSCADSWLITSSVLFRCYKRLYLLHVFCCICFSCWSHSLHLYM